MTTAILPATRGPGVSPALTRSGSESSVPGTQRISLPVRPPQRWRPRTGTVSAARVGNPDTLLGQLADLAAGDPRRAAARARAIEWYLPMAAHLARKFTGRGEPVADLTQVAVIGLIKAVDRYDAQRGSEFASYAIPTILGEIKRYFRDAAWHIRVPRGVQELKLKLPPAVEDLTQALHRPPTTTELAARLGVSHHEIVTARRSSYAYRPLSLQQPAPCREDHSLLDTVGVPDQGIEAVDHRETLHRSLAELPEREQRIIALRYLADMTQTEIATHMGLSQMHVSRLLARALTQLRTGTDRDMLSTRGSRRSRVAGIRPGSPRRV